MLHICKISRAVNRLSRPILIHQQANYSNTFVNHVHNLKKLEPLVTKYSNWNSIQIICVPRFFSQDCKDDAKKKAEAATKIPKDDGDCKPPVACPPPKGAPQEKHEGQYPYLDHCPHSKKPPLPPCQEELPNANQYLHYIIMGLLLTAGTLGMLMFIKLNTKKEEYRAPPKKKSEAVCSRTKVIDKFPPDYTVIPQDVPYLIIGAGTAAFSAFRAIKSSDPKAKVLMITKECKYPYMRPPLSKEMWYNPDKKQVENFIFKQWNGSARSIFYEPDEFYLDVDKLMESSNGGVAVARGYEVDRIDVLTRTVYLKDDDYEIRYKKCLIATGATPKTLPVVERAIKNTPAIEDRVYLFRTIEDFKYLYDALKDTKAIAIIGGGFLGSELACSLSRKGKSGIDVFQVIREGGNMAKVLPEYLSEWTTRKVCDEGVDVKTNTSLVSVELTDNRLHLMLSTGEELIADQLILAIGAEPNTELAVKSNLEIEPDCGGYLVNTELLARTNLYIAGDCSCFYDTKLGRRRVEHHDHAVVSGRLAGENMAGAALPYKHQSMFWSDLGPEVGFEAIGIVDSTLPTVGVFAKATAADTPKAVVTATDEGIRSLTEEEAQECRQKGHTPDGKGLGPRTPGQMQVKPREGEDFGKGVIFYLSDDVVVGIVLWNVFNRMSVARQVLEDGKKYEDLNEVAKLFNIHDE